MGDRTRIEWTGATWNPVHGCTEVSAGCDNCYAATLARGRLRSNYLKRPALPGGGDPADPFAVRLAPHRLNEPRTWGEPRMVFVNSMSDLFHKAIPTEYIEDIFRVMLQEDRHTYQILTKRPARAAQLLRRFAPVLRYNDLPPHIWIGTSVESQEVDYRIRQLLDVPASILFLSCEPLLGPLDLGLEIASNETPGGSFAHCAALELIDWVIVGGESGPNARPMNIEWARSIVRQCRAASVPVFVKQLGRWIAGDEDGFVPQRWLFPDGSVWVPGVIGEHNWRRPEGAVAFGLSDPKGGDMSHWPEDLRTREMPE